MPTSPAKIDQDLGLCPSPTAASDQLLREGQFTRPGGQSRRIAVPASQMDHQAPGSSWLVTCTEGQNVLGDYLGKTEYTHPGTGRKARTHFLLLVKAKGLRPSSSESWGLHPPKLRGPLTDLM